MRLVAVSTVKNEADIIESFVRHTLAWVDHLLVFDHDSTDGTREILQALRAEGLPLDLFTDHAIGNWQQHRNNHLTRLAATAHAADWVLTLDADEFLTGPGRVQLERRLTAIPRNEPAAVFLVNYYATAEDDAHLLNPAERLRFCQAGPPTTPKVFTPRSLAIDPQVVASKGCHELLRAGQALPPHSLSHEFYLAHLALRSVQQSVLRVVLAELQKLSGGQAFAGLDTHYRLGFQLLAENPARFFETVQPLASTLVARPFPYRGTPFRHTPALIGWERVATALLPFLEKLARHHGTLSDAQPRTLQPTEAPAEIFRLPESFSASSLTNNSLEKFSGFVPVSGWGPAEGPVPEAFLPRFHWSLAPFTELLIESPVAGLATLDAEVLTYSENQIIAFELNGTHQHQHHFVRTNQKERLLVPLPLVAGKNALTIRYAQALRTDYDPRLLAAIFISLRITPVTTASSLP